MDVGFYIPWGFTLNQIQISANQIEMNRRMAQNIACIHIAGTWIINWTSLISRPRAATFVATNVMNFPDLKPDNVTCNKQDRIKRKQKRQTAHTVYIYIYIYVKKETHQPIRISKFKVSDHESITISKFI